MTNEKEEMNPNKVYEIMKNKARTSEELKAAVQYIGEHPKECIRHPGLERLGVARLGANVEGAVRGSVKRLVREVGKRSKSASPGRGR